MLPRPNPHLPVPSNTAVKMTTAPKDPNDKLHPIDRFADSLATDFKKLREARESSVYVPPVAWKTLGGSVVCTQCVQPTQANMTVWGRIDAPYRKPLVCSICGETPTCS